MDIDVYLTTVTTSTDIASTEKARLDYTNYYTSSTPMQADSGRFMQVRLEQKPLS